MPRSSRSPEHDLLIGEWACLGIVSPRPTHGFAVAAELKPDAPLGRVWSMSRALTYRCLDQLEARGHIEPIAEEPGIAGGSRTILAATRRGRGELRRWLRTPVAHVRDLRSELLLKLLLAERCDVDIDAMLIEQRAIIESTIDGVATRTVPGDLVALWRLETSRAALRFLDQAIASR
jgi:PadR family transcriptional regulator AphA